MRRYLLLVFASTIYLSTKAQTPLPVGNIGFTTWPSSSFHHSLNDSNHLNQKWYFSKYAGVSAGYSFFNGGGASYISAPFVLQLNHPLNDNLIAFAGISAAPTFFSFSHAFTDPAYSKSYPGSYLPNTYTFGVNSTVEMGLMYVNDAKTFSISGSIGIERGSYPVYPAERVNRKNQK